jgi:acetyltransferase-like isoleucine patch superfamily enzyme
VTILGGVSIGEGAVIGANAVVTKNIPAGAIAVGIPAQVIKP